MGITDYYSHIKTLLVKIPNAELKAELLAALLDAQGAALALHDRVTQLREENARLSDEIRKRDELAEVAGQLFYARHAYWKKNEEDDSAYCPTCWDTKRFLVHLMRKGATGHCHSCKSEHIFVYDGPRPSEGDSATHETPSQLSSLAEPKLSRRQ